MTTTPLDDRDLRPAACENDEVCDWVGVVDDLDGDHDCPQCFEPTVRYDLPAASGCRNAPATDDPGRRVPVMPSCPS